MWVSYFLGVFFLFVLKNSEFLPLFCWDFQDCKEFQGELFGICNLFRDLSDKLFTSEIIELHEKQGKGDGQCSTTMQELPELGTCFLHPDQAAVTTSSACETSDNGNHESVTRKKPVLEELGKYICLYLLLLIICFLQIG